MFCDPAKLFCGATLHSKITKAWLRVDCVKNLYILARETIIRGNYMKRITTLVAALAIATSAASGALGGETIKPLSVDKSSQGTIFTVGALAELTAVQIALIAAGLATVVVLASTSGT